MIPLSQVVVTETNGEVTFAIRERKIMYFVHLALAISAGVILAKAVRAYTA